MICYVFFNSQQNYAYQSSFTRAGLQYSQPPRSSEAVNHIFENKSQKTRKSHNFCQLKFYHIIHVFTSCMSVGAFFHDFRGTKRNQVQIMRKEVKLAEELAP